MLQPYVSSLLLIIFVAFATPALYTSKAAAADASQEITVVIKDHKFTPSEVKIPAGQKVKLIIDNQDATAEEFESHALGIEKVIKGGKKGNVFVGPLKAGSYAFVGEFHADSAKGTIIAE